MTRRHRRIVGCLAATAALAPLTIGALAAPALAGNTQSHQHTICHATASAKNPYVLIHPASAGVMHGHLGHQGGKDIVPPFEYKGEVRSQNWDEAGMAIYENGCEVPQTPVVSPPLVQPPAEEPPVVEPPAEEPPVVEPPLVEPPAEEPPAEEPPGEPLPEEPAPETFGF